MATIQDQNQDPNAPQNPVNQPTTGGTSAAAGTAQGGQTSPGAATNQQPVSPVQQNQNPQNGAGYTDVTSYLNANQQGGQQLGTQVAANLTTGYNNVQNDINNSANTAIGSINSGYIPENTQLIQQVAANPTAAVADPNQLSGYEAQLNDTYTGPTTWADTTDANGNTIGGYGTLQGEVATAQQNADLQNPGTANVLTQQVEQQLNPGQTSQGINALDTLLLTGNPNAVNTVNAAAAPYANLTDYLNNQNTTIGTDVTNAQAAAAQTAQDAFNAVGGPNGTVNTLNNTINSTASSDLTAAQAEQQALTNAFAANYAADTSEAGNAPVTGSAGALANQLATGAQTNLNTLTPAEISELGLTQDQYNSLLAAQNQAATAQFVNSPWQGNGDAWTQTQAVNLGQYLDGTAPTTSNINAGSVATPQQYAEMAAINQLLGTQAPTQTEAINPLNATAAGTAPAGPTFDYTDALAALQGLASGEQQQALTQADQTAQSQEQAHQAGLSKGFTLLDNPLTHYFENPLSVVPQEISAAENEEKKV